MFDLHLSPEAIEYFDLFPTTKSDLAGVILRSGKFSNQELIINTCNYHMHVLLESLLKFNTNVVARKIPNDGSDEFLENELCKVVICDSKFISASDVTTSRVLDNSIVHIDIFEVI